MNLVIAIKAIPDRKARVTDTNRVTILLSDVEEVAVPEILHRDAAYNYKLQGKCFKCSKLNPTKSLPQSVCENCGEEEPKTTCEITEDPCNCANCPVVDGPCLCVCGPEGYPSPTTPFLGSGYWVGLQANTYYSNIQNGGWVVAVSCESGNILGTFPVSGNNFGYGKGNILGIPVMIYPSGTIACSGFLPANDTSFPLLGLIPSDGDEIISSGSFTIISDEGPGCPTEAKADVFCDAINSHVYSGYPKACVAKYPRINSGCPTFDGFFDWPSNLPYDTSSDLFNGPYYINLLNVPGLDELTDVLTGVIKFQTVEGNTYCGTIQDWEPQPSDALYGACGGQEWDIPISWHNDCADCVGGSIDCQYLLNLTNGPFSQTYGGYNAAEAIGITDDNLSSYKGYFAIGPALPPRVDNDGIVDSNHWETFWNWIPTASDDPTDFYYYNGDSIAFIPPIAQLLEICACSCGARHSGTFFIEKFECCDLNNPTISPSGLPVGISVIKPFIPGFAGCGTPCYPECTSLECSCETNHNLNLGKPKKYGYIPCSECESTYPVPVTGIWWSKFITYGDKQSFPTIVTPGQLPNPSERNRCAVVFNSFRPQCSGPCSAMFQLGDSDNYILLPTAFEECTGFIDPNEYLQDICSRTYHLPSRFRYCELEFDINFGNNNITEYKESLANYIKVISDCSDCAVSDPLNPPSLINCLCSDPDPANCYLHYIGGPLGIKRVDDFGGGDCITLGTINQCSVPRIETLNYVNCSGQCVPADGLTFVPIKNDKCKINIDGQEIPYDIYDPCECCKEIIEPNGGGEGIPRIRCSPHFDYWDATDTNFSLCPFCPTCCDNYGCLGEGRFDEDYDCLPSIVYFNNIAFDLIVDNGASCKIQPHLPAAGSC